MFYLMIGLPGSGKTTWARKQNLTILSADNIRKEWYGNSSIQGDGNAIFKELYRRVDKAITAGNDFIVDNTNISSRYREAYFGRGSDVIAVFVNTPLEECLRRNSNRPERVVPKEVILRMAKRLDPPILAEGFKSIIILGG